jgi:Icc-related predicted phosphoesterase
VNDYKRIRNSNRGYKRRSPRDTRNLHLRSLARMEDFFANHDPARTIVVTHHAPSIQSLPAGSRNEPLKCAYASHLDELILRYQPLLWMHGPIHHSRDYRTGKTRVLANPQGYPHEPNPNFQPALVLQIPD